MMKKFLLLAAAVLGMVACTPKDNNDPAAPETTGKKVVLHATVATPDDAAQGPQRVAPTNLDQIGTSANINYTWEAGDVVYLLDIATMTPHTFTVVASSISGNTADFVGEEFDGLSTGAYMAVYSGTLTISEVLDAANVTIAYPGATFKPVACSTGAQSATAFTLDQFTMVLHFKLKGDVTLGRMEYWGGLNEKGNFNLHRTITFGSGLTLSTSTAADVYFPIQLTSEDGFTLRFYDTADNLIMEKTSETNLNNSAYNGKILNFPELTVAATISFTLTGSKAAVKTAVTNLNPGLIGTFTVPAGTTMGQYIESLGTIDGLNTGAYGYAFTVGSYEYSLSVPASTVITNNQTYTWKSAL